MTKGDPEPQHPLVRYIPFFAGALVVAMVVGVLSNRNESPSVSDESTSPSPEFPAPDVPADWRTYVNINGYLIDYPPNLVPQEVTEDPSAAQFGPDIRSQIVKEPYTACSEDCPIISEETKITLARRECMAVIAEPAATDSRPGPIYFYECPHEGQYFRFTYRPANGVESIPLRRTFARMANSLSFQ
ncbi:MAG: hypothetical protein N2691_06075 [Patescibacteria group bacterium]|nr:hypothetical protein [Patescibacteria group bacterium]